ncbi:uncharacterized protein METZ01_LOCUS505959, partial [marine metagenome]
MRYSFLDSPHAQGFDWPKTEKLIFIVFFG